MCQVIDFITYKKYKESVKLLERYTRSLCSRNKAELTPLIAQWQEENRKYPNHFLVLIKARELFSRYMLLPLTSVEREAARKIHLHATTTISDRINYKRQETAAEIPQRTDNDLPPAS